MACKCCNEPLRLDSLEKEYEEVSRTPIYFYTMSIVISALIVMITNANLKSQKEKVLFVENPHVGDVYTIRKEADKSTGYFFLKVADVRNDTVIAYHSNLVYNGFVSKLNEEDYFVKDEELFFTKMELKQMLEKEEINSVDREYGEYEGFSRTRLKNLDIKNE